MKIYFERHYPRRLEELKTELEAIATEMQKASAEKEYPNPNFEKLGTKFYQCFWTFCENTKLHITACKTPDESYINRVSKEYIFHFLGGKETNAGFIFWSLYLKKEEGGSK